MILIKKYVQYGCGLSAPVEWENYDASPTLILQRIPLLGRLLRSRLNVEFPSNVKYGDIIKGLPVPLNSCDGVYCSHTLEHLSLQDFRKALANTLKILKPDGIFRVVVPDLEWAARTYVQALDSGNKSANAAFLNETLLGLEVRPTGLRGFASSFLGNSHHLWMWDQSSLSDELDKAGFKGMRSCTYNDSSETAFKLVEDSGRFCNAVAIECKK